MHKPAQRPHEVERLEPLRALLTRCATICDELCDILNEFTSHSKDNQINIRDWLKMRYRGKSFEDMKNRLASYKSTITIALQSIDM
jgi:hypothetical protein